MKSTVIFTHTPDGVTAPTTLDVDAARGVVDADILEATDELVAVVVTAIESAAGDTHAVQCQNAWDVLADTEPGAYVGGATFWAGSGVPGGQYCWSFGFPGGATSVDITTGP